MKRFLVLAVAVCGCLFNIGCGDNKTVIPPALTEEQKKAIKAEDEKVANEEGGRKQNKKGGKAGK